MANDLMFISKPDLVESPLNVYAQLNCWEIVVKDITVVMRGLPFNKQTKKKQNKKNRTPKFQMNVYEEWEESNGFWYEYGWNNNQNQLLNLMNLSFMLHSIRCDKCTQGVSWSSICLLFH